jgi:ribose transport system permease protein
VSSTSITGRIRPNTRSVIYIYLFLLVFLVAMSVLFPLFASQRNITNLAIQIAPLAIVGIGQTLVIIGGGVDLSVGAVMSLTTVIAANMMQPGTWGIIGGLCAALCAAVVVGLLNGFICSRTNIPPLIATLCTANIVQGVILWYRAEPGGKIPRELTQIILGKVATVSVPTILMIFFYLLFMFMMARTKLGAHTYAIGDNEEYARMAGVNVPLTRITGYVLCALIAAVAGLLMGCRIGSGNPLVGNSYQTDSLAAVLVGATPFTGGQGLVIGTFAGAAIVTIIRNALNISGVSPFYQYIAKGALLILAMIINSVAKKKE